MSIKKRIFLALLALGMILTAAACRKNNVEGPSGEDTGSESVTETTAQTEEIPQVSSAELYAPVLQLYKFAYASSDPMAQFEADGLSRLNAYTNAETQGYAITDINRDGIDELVVGIESSISDIFTLEDGKPIKLATASERDMFFVDANGVILNRMVNSAFSSVEGFYTLENGALKLDRFIILDSEPNGEPEWFVSTTIPDPSMAAPITAEEAEAILKSYKEITFEFTPFSSVQ